VKNSSNEKIVAYLILVVEVGKEYSVHGELQKMEEIEEAYVVYGEFDIIAKVVVENLGSLESVVMRVRRIPGVLRTTTLIAA